MRYKTRNRKIGQKDILFLGHSVCLAAIHFGVLDLFEGEEVTIKNSGTCGDFKASIQNNVKSQKANDWDLGSFTFLPAVTTTLDYTTKETTTTTTISHTSMSTGGGTLPRDLGP